MAASAAQKATNPTPDDSEKKQFPELRPIPEGGSKVVPFPSAAAPTPSQQHYTKLSEVEKYAHVAFDLTNLSEEQREILQTTFANLRTIVDGTKPEFPDDYWINTKVYVLSDDNRLELRTPYLSNRPNHISEDEFAKNFLPPSRLLGVVLALSRVFTVPTKDTTPNAVITYLQDWGAIITAKVGKDEIQVVNEATARKHWLQIRNLWAVLQTEYQKIIQPVEKEVGAAEPTEQTEAEKQTSTAVVPPSVGAGTGPSASEAGGGEAGGQTGEPTAQPRPDETPLQTPDTTQARRQAINYESLWLTNAILFDLCRQHGIEPSPQLMRLLRETTVGVLQETSPEELQQLFANPGPRRDALKQIELELARSGRFVGLLRIAYDAHMATLSPEAAAAFAQKINYNQANPVIELKLSAPTETDIINTIAPLIGTTDQLEGLDATNITQIIKSLALGMGSERYQSYISHRSNEELARLLAPKSDQSNLQELTQRIANNRTVILAVLTAYGLQNIYSQSALTGMSQIDQVGILTGLLGLEKSEQPTPAQISDLRQLFVAYGEKAVVAAVVDKHPLSNNQQALKELDRQMSRNWAGLPEQVQRLIYQEFGQDPILDPDGSLPYKHVFVGADVVTTFLTAKKINQELERIRIKLELEKEESIADLAQVENVLVDMEPVMTLQQADDMRAALVQEVFALVAVEQQEELQQILEQMQNEEAQAVAASVSFDPSDPASLDPSDPAQLEQIIANLSTDHSAPTPAMLAHAVETYNESADPKRKINFGQIKRAYSQLAKKAEKEAVGQAASTAAAAVSGPVGWAAKAAFIAAQMRTEEGRKQLQRQIATFIGGGVVLAGALMGFLGEVGGGIFGALGAGSMGAATGAFLGTFIFPGVGTALGALIGAGLGGTLGAFAGKSAGAKWAARQGLGGSADLGFKPQPVSQSGTGMVKYNASPAQTTPATSPSALQAQAPTPPPTPPPATPAAAPVVAAATLGTFGLMSAAAWMPLMSIGVLVFISVYTIYTIFAAFLAPIPVGTSTSIRDGSGNQYLNLKKTVAPNRIPNIVAGQPTTVTYTVEITPKAGYTIKLLDTTDTMKSLPATPKPPEKKAVWTWTPTNQPYITKDSFAPLSPEGLIAGQVKAEYFIQFTEGVDALVTNTVTIKYDVFKTTGESVVTNQTFTDYSSLRIGNPKVLCWPTTGIIYQLPFCDSSSSYTHCKSQENAYDIASDAVPKPDVFAPIDGTVKNIIIPFSPFGIHVSLKFVMPDGPNGGQSAELIFAHLASVDPSISSTNYTSIQAGERIGLMGSTGNSTGPHLHYELKPSSFKFEALLPGGIAPAIDQQVQTCYGN